MIVRLAGIPGVPNTKPLITHIQATVVVDNEFAMITSAIL
jgi:hypothetical protein